MVLVDGGLGTLAPGVIARKAVREDLVHDGVLVPGRQRVALLVVHGDLERRRHAIGEGPLAHLTALARAIAPDVTVGGLEVDRVPEDVGRLWHVLHSKADATVGHILAGTLHGNELLVATVLLVLVLHPQVQGGRGLGLVPNVNAQRDRIPQRQGPVRLAIRPFRSYVSCSHVCTPPPVGKMASIAYRIRQGL